MMASAFVAAPALAISSSAFVGRPCPLRSYSALATELRVIRLSRGPRPQPSCALLRLAPPSVLPRPVRHARIAVLTDFASNPVRALADRASDPLFLLMLLAAAVIGAVLARLFAPRKSVATAPVAPAAISDPVRPDDPVDVTSTAGFETDLVLPLSVITPAENATWLNMGLRTLWLLFRKSTAALVRDVLQPALDSLQLPSNVSRVRLTKLELGSRPALVRNIRRIPSRALCDLQYRLDVRIVGDNSERISAEIDLRLPLFPRGITLPVTVSNLDIDARVWVSVTLVPRFPWVRFTQWAFLDLPDVKVNVNIGRYLPVTAIPLLSDVLIRIFTRELPKQFVFPKVNFTDLLEDPDGSIEQGEFTEDAPDIDVRELDSEELHKIYPTLSALFDELDTNDDGVLTKSEIINGLINWGFASKAESEPIAARLDLDNDGYIQLHEFVAVWPQLQPLFVPRRFRGVLSGVLLEAEGLREPTLGYADPYVLLSVESQSTRSKNHRSTSKQDLGNGRAAWYEGWELYVENPLSAILRVEVREGSPFAFYKDNLSPPRLPGGHSETPVTDGAVERENRIATTIGFGSLAVASFQEGPTSLWVDLTKGGGRVRFDIQFFEFVDSFL